MLLLSFQQDQNKYTLNQLTDPEDMVKRIRTVKPIDVSDKFARFP